MPTAPTPARGEITRVSPEIAIAVSASLVSRGVSGVRLSTSKLPNTPGTIPVATLPAILRVRKLEGTLSSCDNGRFVVLSRSR
eukprot:scaffold53691_cov108-Phaeocystis_antarctica.AAC.1